MDSRIAEMQMSDIPPSFNHVWKHMINHGHVQVYMSKAGRDFKKKAKDYVNAIGCTSRPVKVNIEITFPTKRRCDVENYTKILLDAMNGIAYKDDSQIQELHITRKYDKGKPHTYVLVTEIDVIDN